MTSYVFSCQLAVAQTEKRQLTADNSSSAYRRISFDDALGARQHIGAGRAPREDMLGDRHEAACVLQVHMLADPDYAVLDLDHIVGVLAALAPLATPRGGRPALADDGSLAQIGARIQRRADIGD